MTAPTVETPALAETALAALLAQAEARHAPVARTLHHWDRLRGTRALPGRDEIDPSELADALEYLFIAEPVAPGVARLRLAGQHLSLLLGMEPRGMPLCALFDAPARDAIAQALDQTVRHGLRALMPLGASGGIGRPPLDGMMALMPMGPAAWESGNQPARLLGALHMRGTIGRAPRRLSLAGPVRALPTGRRPRPALRLIAGGRA